MKTYSEIYTELSNALTSQNWQRLKKSAVGRELLAYGSRVIMQSDTIVSQLSDSFDYTLAGKRALLSLAHTQEIPISFVKPSWVRIRVAGTGVYSPFRIKYTVGNLSFYNTEYVQLNPSGVVILLKQGVAKTMESSNTDLNIAYWDNQSTPEIWDETYLTVSDSDIVLGHVLGEVDPDSIYMFYQEGVQLNMVSKFTPLSYGPETNSFKAYNLYDGTVAILDGDGTWGAEPVPDATYQIYWLQPTAEPFEDTGKLFISSSEVSDTLYQVISSAQGSYDNIEYARGYFRRQYLKNNVVASYAQIRDFVNSYECVLDCNVIASNNVVTVYVKPEVEGDIGDYDVIAAQLELYGILLTTYEVDRGTEVGFTLGITGVDVSYRNTIQEFLTDYLSYSRLPFKYTLNVAEISALIQSRFGVTCQVTVEVSTRATTPTTLSFLPVPGSIKIYSGESLVGYDSNSIIYGISSSSVFNVNFSNAISIVNGMWYFPTEVGSANGTLVTYQEEVKMGSPISQGSSLEVQWMQQNNGYVFTRKGSNIRVYQKGQITSAAALATVTLNPVASIVTLGVYSGSFRTWLYVDSSLLKFSSSGGSLFVSFNNVLSNGSLNEYFVLNIPVSLTIKAVYQEDNTLYVLGTNRAVIIKHFMSSNYSFYIANYPSGFPTILDIDCEDTGCIGLLVESGSDYILYRCSSILVDDLYNIDFVKTEIIRIPVSEVGTPESCYVSQDSAFFMASPNIVIAGSTPETYEVLDSMTVYDCVAVGSVNYDTGYMVFSGIGNVIKYKSSASPNLPADQYLKFNNIVWG